MAGDRKALSLCRLHEVMGEGLMQPAAAWSAAPLEAILVTIAGMELSENQRRFLRGRAHPLKPIIQIGKTGLTDAVTKETARALHDHELIKVRAPGADRDARDALLADLAKRTGSSLVHRIGHVAVLYRANKTKPGLIIPDPKG
jgi:RNA-binding protein